MLGLDSLCRAERQTILALDITDIEGVEAGDIATLIGEGISAEEVAEWSNTSAYEVLLAIGARVRRRYSNGPGVEPRSSVPETE